jgi:hypothetical protein
MTETTRVWPLWQRIGFRFVCVYWLLQIAPWGWLESIPWLGKIVTPYNEALDWGVRTANARLFHVRETLVEPSGSGDTSWAWAALWLCLSVSLITTLGWSILDRRRSGYPRAAYALRTIVRYYVALFALSYGIIKVFALQMQFPALSQLATPLGDLTPMRFAWFFIGYSTPFQVVSGLVETMAGLLLLMRRTVTLGLVVATVAFANVVLINFSYDVPVKLFASHLLLACVFLLVQDAPRLWAFFVRNRPVAATSLYDPPPVGRRMGYALRTAKWALSALFVVMPVLESWPEVQPRDRVVAALPLPAGVYDVRRWAVNGDTIPPQPGDTLRWRDVVIDDNVSGSVGSADSLFAQRYRRGYFRYRTAPSGNTLTVSRPPTRGGSPLFTMRYELPSPGVVRLWTIIRGDSVYVELVRSNRRFRLAEREFHWLSESVP